MHEAQDVGVITLARTGHALVVRVARHALDGLVSGHLEPLAQREDGPAPLEALDQVAPQLVGPSGALLPPHLVELLRCRGLEPCYEVVEDERVVWVESSIVLGDLPTRAGQLRHLARDVTLEGVLLVDLAAGDGVLDTSPLAAVHEGFFVAHFAASVQSVLPVTA